MSVRYTKSEIAARKTADATLVDPSASIQAKYHAQLILKNTKKDALARAEKNEPRPDTPVLIHRVPVPEDPNAKAFLDALERMLKRQCETRSAEASHPETPAASGAPRSPKSEALPGNEICTLCLIPRENCGHGDLSK